MKECEQFPDIVQNKFPGLLQTWDNVTFRTTSGSLQVDSTAAKIKVEVLAMESALMFVPPL